MLVTNLFGQPGAGKSTTAAGVFSQLKLYGIRAELVTEFAKDMTWEQNNVVLNDPAAVFGEQNRRMWRLRGKVDVVVTDSPLLLSCIYAPDGYPPEFHMFVEALTNQYYDNVNFMIQRVKAYDPIGRNQNEAEAADLANKIEDYLKVNDIDYMSLKGNEAAVATIVFQIMDHLPLK